MSAVRIFEDFYWQYVQLQYGKKWDIIDHMHSVKMQHVPRTLETINHYTTTTTSIYLRFFVDWDMFPVDFALLDICTIFFMSFWSSFKENCL